jgi:hypothetical protein
MRPVALGESSISVGITCVADSDIAPNGHREACLDGIKSENVVRRATDRCGPESLSPNEDWKARAGTLLPNERFSGKDSAERIRTCGGYRP